MIRLGIFVAAGLVCASALAADPVQRTLSFEERVKHQTAIERVYYSHQTGATKPFEEAVPKAVIEAKVHKYLEQSVALDQYWKTPVTDYSLQRELERMAQGTRMPERLKELYAALGNDAFVIKETLARAALVDRLAHSFYDFDPRMHAPERAQIDELRRRLVSGELSPSAAHPNRIVEETVAAGQSVALPTLDSRRELTAPEIVRRTPAERPGPFDQIGEIAESRHLFEFSVNLDKTATNATFARYVVPKTNWDVWWGNARRGFKAASEIAVASSSVVPVPKAYGSDPACVDDTWDNGSLGMLPEGRSDHTAVWTGSEMIIWGGERTSGGWRYDPSTDTWAPVSNAGAPSAQMGHSAIWTGAAMAIWGGYDGVGYSIGGGRYDPIADSWTPISTSGAPSPRYGHSAVQVGRFMVVWGGWNNTSSFQNTGGRYDPLTDTWLGVTTAGAPTARLRHTAVGTGRTMIVWGGEGLVSSFPPTSALLNTGGSYDVEHDFWSPTATSGAPLARSTHGAVWTGREMVIWGGYNSGYLNSGGKYDPTTNTWSPTSTVRAPMARSEVKAVWTGLTMIVWGGFGDSGGFDLNTGGQYDPATDTWIATSSVGAPTPRSEHTAVWTGHLMIIWGGSYYNIGGRYDPVTDSWTPTSANGMPPALENPSTVWTGSLMVVWGYFSTPSNNNVGGRYDPVLDNWTPTTVLGAPSARRGHSTVWTGNEMIVWGGTLYDSWHSERLFNDGGRYDPVSDSWQPTTLIGAPTKRAEHTAVWSGDTMVVWGGDNYIHPGPSYLATGARYDPANDSWTTTSTSDAPVARKRHSAIWTGNRMIVWGGQIWTSPYLTTTGGSYDPIADAWTSISNIAAPLGRTQHAAVWTGTRMVIWGGRSANQVENTGGQYNPTLNIWTPTASQGAPVPRGGFSSIWTGRRMVVWGGFNDSNFGVNTGGRYDPATNTWAPTTIVMAPTPRGSHAATWSGKEMIVWGGSSNTGGRYVVNLPSDDCDDDGYTGLNGDCDDSRRRVYPGAPQVCDGADNDCANPSWPTLPPDETDADGDGYPLCAGDCDDARAGVHPDADEICNGLDDDCNGLVDDGGGASCDDGNECTQDVCAGACVHAPIAGSCDDGNVCTGGDACAAGVCTGSPVSGVACDDGNACTTDDFCNSVGDCLGGPSRVCDDGDACNGLELCTPWTGCLAGAPPDCQSTNQCIVGRCESASGCVFTEIAGSCDDGNPCTRGDVCSHGSCLGTMDHGAHCDDGDPCTVDDACYGYYCYGGPPLDCDDGNACTVDYCDWQIGGCVNTNEDTLPCSDGDLCTHSDACHSGVCTSEAVVCSSTCPPGFTPLGNDCQRTYLVDASLLDNQGAICTESPANRYTCQDSMYGFHWSDLGYSFAGVIGVDVRFVAGFNCETFPVAHTVKLNGASIGSFSRPYNGDSCTCLPNLDLETKSFLNIDPAGYVLAGNNSVSITRGLDCQGLSAGLDGSFAEVTVRYARFGLCLAVGACNPSTGACQLSDAAEGAACDDENPCTSGDSCGQGVCAGSPTNGSPCSNGDLCAADVCFEGVCAPGPPRDCNDQDVCTYDYCEPAVGCVHDSTIAGDLCDDGDPCTLNLCDPVNFCVFPPVPVGGDCDDFLSCTHNDRCNNTGACVGISVCSDGNPCTDDYADELQSCACTHVPSFPGTACEDGDACTAGEVCDDSGTACAGGGPIDCDDDNPCTTDTCDPATGCVHTNNSEPCNDGNACTTSDVCGGGTCNGGAPLGCDDSNPCTDDTCNAVAGCVRTNNAEPCDDGNGCTQSDLCAGGACTGSNPVVCAPLDQCHTAGTCSPATGTCSNPARPDGTTCNDSDLCTRGETCRAGTCTPATSGLNEPKPQSTAYYRLLCRDPSSGDPLTDADAVCVSSVAQTFAGIANVAHICAELMLNPTSNPCDGAEDQLMVLALNICRGRVCTAQRIDSHCGDSGDVAASLAKSDAILRSAPTDDASCADAKCLAEEINTGRALELNSLLVSREGSAVRLTWQPPYFNEGAGLPRRYEVWRRPMGSLSAFIKIAEPIDPAFVDETATGGAYQYEVTAVMN